MSAPRPFVRDPFHPLISITNIKQFLFISDHQLCFPCGTWNGYYFTYAHAATAETFKVILFVSKKKGCLFL